MKTDDSSNRLAGVESKRDTGEDNLRSTYSQRGVKSLLLRHAVAHLCSPVCLALLPLKNAAELMCSFAKRTAENFCLVQPFLNRQVISIDGSRVRFRIAINNRKRAQINRSAGPTELSASTREMLG